MFFNKSKVQPMGKLTDEEMGNAEKTYRDIVGVHLAITNLSARLGELEQARMDWWDKVVEDHMINYDKKSESLTYDTDGTINKQRK